MRFSGEKLRNCVLLFCFFIISSGVLYLMEEISRINRERAFFFNLVNDKNSRIDALRIAESGLSEYETKNQLLEWIFSRYLLGLEEGLEALMAKGAKPSRRDFSEFISGLRLPLEKSVGVYFSYNGRFLQQKGRSFDVLLGENTLQIGLEAVSHFLRGRNDDFVTQRFERSIGLINPFMLNVERFVRLYLNRFENIHIYSLDRGFCQYLGLIEPGGELNDEKPQFLFFIYVDMSDLTEEILAGEIIQFFVEEQKKSEFYPMSVLESSDCDSFEFMGQTFSSTDSSHGLRWVSSIGSYSLFLRSSPVFLFLFLIFSLLFFYSGGWISLQRDFSLKFRGIFLFFSIFIYYLFRLAFGEFYENRLLLIERDVHSSWLQQLQALEKRFHSFRSELSSNLGQEFKTWDGGFDKIFQQYNLSWGILTEGEGYYFSEGIDSFNGSLLAGFLPYCLVCAGESFNDFAEIEDIPERVTKIRRHYFKKQFGFRSIIEEKMAPVYEKHPEIFNSIGFGDFLFFELMQDGIYLWRALRKRADGKHMALLVSVSGAQMQNIFLNWFYEREKAGLDFLLCPLRNKEKLLGSFSMSRREWKELYYRYYGRTGQLFDIQAGNRRAAFLSSPVFTNHVFLFSMDKAELYGSLIKMERYWYVFSIFYFFCCFLLSFSASGILLAPVQKLISGFDRIKTEDFDFVIPHQGRDEGAMVLKSFNSMVGELLMKKQMQPFVSENLIWLFRDENTESRIISGQAAVLFSDIRSFTTISETHDARDVVDMLNDYFELWSSIVEAYGGIIDKFIGDAVRVIFFEKTSPDYIANAVKAAVEMRKALVDFDAERYRQGLFEVENGIGIAVDHIGFSVVGNEEKLEFLIVGDAGERAEFLESMTKGGRFTHICVDDRTAHYLSGVYEFTPVEDSGGNALPCFELKGLIA